MSPSSITPYVFFCGRCDEAIAFYREAIGAQVEFLMRYNESPHPAPPGMLPPGFEAKVMHATLRIGNIPLMVSDGNVDKGQPEGFKLSLEYPSEGEARQAFDALASGGSVEMPLSKTFWSPCFGMLTDRFGLSWMVTVPGAPAP